MACKIADDLTAVQPVSWASVASKRTVQPSLTAPHQQSNSNDRESEVRLVEFEQQKRLDLAQCRKTAFDEGVKTARDEAAAQLKAADDRLAQTLRDLIVTKRRMRNEAESDVVQLSLAIAKRILHRELTIDPESIQGVVHAGLQKLQNREISKIRVCPSALETVKAILERAGITTGSTIVADPKLHNGDVVFETAFGELDASIDTQLKEIERGFSDRLGLAC